MLSKGGPSYASVSIIVQDRFRECFVLLPELGSNRRMWVEVRVSGVTQLFWLVYYLPPDPGQGADNEWHAEMSGIMADLQTLSASKPNIPVVLSGDANVQPAVLGAGPDKKLQRDLRVQTLLQEYSLTLRNPLVQEGNIFPIHLPKRD